MTAVLTDIGIVVWIVWVLLVIWAYNQLGLHMKYGCAGAYRWLGQLSGPRGSWSHRDEGWPINLPIYIVFGYCRDIEDSTVRRYGHIVRYSLLGWFGFAVLLWILINSYM